MDDGVRADYLTIGALTSFLAGEPHEEQIDEAVEIEDRVSNDIGAERRTVYSGGRVTRGLIAMWAGDHEAARGLLETELRRFEAQGRYVAKDEILCYLAHLACRTGDLVAGERYAEECLEIGAESGHVLGRGQNLLPRAWLAALRGDHDLARRDAREGLELSLRYQDALAVATAHGVLGLVATSLGDAAAGADHLVHVVQLLRRSGVHRPGMVPFVAEAICALVAAGRLDEAAGVCEDDRLTGRSRPECGAGLATVRGVAMLRAATGDLEGAATLLNDVLADVRLRAQPFEHGRALMAAGEVARRRRSRASARIHLDGALEVFTRLGAESWSRQVRADLERLGTVGGPASELTPTELQVVGLVVEGLTNRQVADRLFVSAKTVEANLTHVYRKTGVRSRQEVVRWWLSRQGPPP
jgi:DNA-binding CsgD family transcriptional regulator